MITDEFFADESRSIDIRSVYLRILSFGIQICRRCYWYQQTIGVNVVTGVWYVNGGMRNGITMWLMMNHAFVWRMHDGHVLVRWRRGERRDSRFAVESHIHNIMGLTVRGAIAYGSR